MNDDDGASAIHPKVLLKIILLAYSRGMMSSRQMERACVENVTMMALACGYTPDHSTIAAFVSSMQAEVESVFCNVLLVCDQLGLLAGIHFSLDGVKLSANVSKEWSGTFDELKGKRDERFADQERFKDGAFGGMRRTDKKRQPFSLEDFKLDAARQVYLCPQGKELSCHAHNQRNRHRLYDIYHARAEDCAECPVRLRCLSKSSASRRYLSVQVEEPEPNALDEMKAKIDSPPGKKVYARRLGIVEPMFANICVHKHLNRFTLRTKSKVDVQWTRTRFALVHNIGKICVFGVLQ